MEKENKFNELLNKYTNKEFLIPILQEIQGIYGYLSYKQLKIVSEKLNVSLEEIYSVASFYNQFKFNPNSKYKISVCLGTVCYVKGANNILEEIKKILNINEGETTEDGLFSIEKARCLGCCSLAPVMMINDKVYSEVKIENVKLILDSYRGKANE
jgi:NADH:ubiquinone oxidoreductase subunit E